jgi:hypothetical protein
MSRRHRLGLGIGGRSAFREPRLEGRQDRRRNGSGTASRRAWQPGLAGYRGLRRYSRLGTSLDGRRLGRGLQGVQNGLGVTAGLGQSPLSILSVLVHAASPSESISFRAAHRTAKKRRASGVGRSVGSV